MNKAPRDETVPVMRCADVTKEIAIPSGSSARTDLDRHLAACPACASFARSSDTLDRVWAATAPPEPTAESFDALWSAVESAARTPEILPFSRTFTAGRLYWGAAVLANAAAVLLMVYLFAPKPPVRVPSQPSVVALAEIPVESDVTCVIRINDDGVEVDHIEPDAASLAASNADLSLHSDVDALNQLESMAE